MTLGGLLLRVPLPPRPGSLLEGVVNLVFLLVLANVLSENLRVTGAILATVGTALTGCDVESYVVFRKHTE